MNIKYGFLIIPFLIFSINTDIFGQGKFDGGDGSGYAMSQISNITLPVELIDFAAFQIDNIRDVKVHWEVASETNLDYYTLEKSKDAINWETLGKHYPNPSFKYQFIDKKPHEGITYYRLKNTDLDGRFDFSKIVSVDINNNTDINIYPNPANQLVNINIRTAEKNKYNIQVYDSFGKIIWQQKIEEEITDWNGKIEINKSGIYIVNIVSDGNVLSEKVIILE